MSYYRMTPGGALGLYPGQQWEGEEPPESSVRPDPLPENANWALRHNHVACEFQNWAIGGAQIQECYKEAKRIANPWGGAATKNNRTRLTLCQFFKPQLTRDGWRYNMALGFGPSGASFLVGHKDNWGCWVVESPPDPNLRPGKVFNAIERWFRGRNMPPETAQAAIMEEVAYLQQGILAAKWRSRSEWLNDPGRPGKAALAEFNRPYSLGRHRGYSGRSIYWDYQKPLSDATNAIWQTVRGAGEGEYGEQRDDSMTAMLLLGGAVIGGALLVKQSRKGR